MAPHGGFLTNRTRLTVLSFLLMLSSCFSQKILEPPESITVFPDQPAVFSCEVEGGHTSWIVNGKSLNELTPSEIRADLETSESTSEDGNPVEILTIRARPQYNGTTVQCVTFGGFSDESETVTLRIQGLLSAVTGLEATYNASSVAISWTAPFSLGVNGVDPDIWYTLFCYNVTDDKTNPVLINCPECINMTNTNFTFTPDHPSPCHKYNFSVTPFNGAGPGESSRNVTGFLLNTRGPRVKFSVEVVKELGEDKRRVSLNSMGDIESVCHYTFRSNGSELGPSSVDGATFTFTLTADERYSVQVSVHNAAGDIEIETMFNFTTFDVQNATASVSGSEITTTGVFITDTTARGYFVVLQCEIGSPDVFRALMRDGDETTVTSTIRDVPASTYRMLVYDLESDGLPNTLPAVEPPNTLTVDGKDSVSPAILKTASISVIGSAISISCEFFEVSSCVLVYREYGNETLMVDEYPQTTMFPVSVTVGPGNYTFCIFGRNSTHIDESPFETRRIVVQSSPAIMPGEENDSTQPVAAVTVGVVMGLVFTATVISVVAILLCMKKSAKRCGDQAPHEMVTSLSYESIKGTGGALGILREGSGTSVTPPLKDSQTNGIPVTTGKGGYTTVVLSPGARPPPSVAQSVQYQEVDLRATKRMAHPQGLLYAEMGPPPPNRAIIMTTGTEKDTKYSTILPHATCPLPDGTTCGESGGLEEKEGALTAPVMNPRVPPTVESVMSLLLEVAGQWRAIAEGLGFSEHRIDEIETNNETEEVCLRDCLEQWVPRLGPSWDQLATVLSDLGLGDLAQQAGLRREQQSPVVQRQTIAMSGRVSEAQPEPSRSGDGGGTEVVTGGQGNTPSTDGREDGNKGVQTVMTDGCWDWKPAGGPAALACPALQDESVSTASGSEEGGRGQCSLSVECSSGEEDQENHNTVSVMVPGTTPQTVTCFMEHSLLDGDACLVGGNVSLLPLDEDENDNTDDQPAFEENTAGCQSESVVWPKNRSSTSLSDNAKAPGRDHCTVAPQQCTTVGAPKDPVRASGSVMEAGEMVPECELDVSGYVSELCTEGLDCHRNLISPSFIDEGMMVVGNICTKPFDMVVTSCDEPAPEPPHTQPLAPPLEPTPPQPRPLEPTPPQSLPPEAKQQQPPQNSPPPHPPLPQSTDKDYTLNPPFNSHQWCDPPENWQEKVVKWLATGVALGFHGPDELCSSSLGLLTT